MDDDARSGSTEPPAPAGPPSVRDVAGPPQEARDGAPPPARPTPVREALEREAPPAPPEVPVPTRRFADETGHTWEAQLVGRTRSGTGSDRGADLALVQFHADGDDPGEVLEVLVPLRALEHLSDLELEALLGRAQPASFEPGNFFGGTRRGPRSE